MSDDEQSQSHINMANGNGSLAKPKPLLRPSFQGNDIQQT